MGSQNLEELDDEDLLILYDSTHKLLQSSLEQEKSSIRNKVEAIRQKLFSIEQELKVRSLWEGE